MRNGTHAVVAVLAFTCASVVQAQADLRPGPYAVGFSQYAITRTGSPVGDRRLAVSIFYPVDRANISGATPRAVYATYPGSSPNVLPSETFDKYGYQPAYTGVPVSRDGAFPLVLYAHGYTSPWLVGLMITPRIASYGYVVASISYPIDVGIPEPGTIRLRHDDTRFIIDHLFARHQTAGDPLAGVLDLSAIAVAGFSYGGYTAVALAAGEDDACQWFGLAHEWACAPAEADPRVTAIVLLDPATWVFEFEELERVRVPVISIHRGVDSWEAEGDWGAWSARHHAAFQSTPNYRVDVDPSNHFRFGIACEYATELWRHGYLTAAQRDAQRNFRSCDDTSLLSSAADVHPLIAEYAVAFLETHVGRRPGMHHILTPGHALSRGQHVGFFVTERGGPQFELEPPFDAFWYFRYQPGAQVEQASKAGGTLVEEEPVDGL